VSDNGRFRTTMIVMESSNLCAEVAERMVDVKYIYWMNLPTELWLNIFKLLPQSTLILVVRHVCQYFRQLVFDPTLWKTINMNSWKATISQTLLAENAHYAKHSCNDDLNEALDSLALDGWLNSSKIFIAIADRVHHVLSNITFSRYNDDFVFGLEEQSALFQCSNLTYLDASFCDEINSSTLSALCSNCTKLKTVIIEGCSSVTDEAMKAICNLQELEILNICHCAGVTDNGLSHIM